MDKVNICAKEKLSKMLLIQDDRAFGIAVLYIVYKTIESNDNITLNKLRRLLSSDLLLKDSTIDGAVAALSSRSVFNAISKWTKPQAESVVHLRLPKTNSLEFTSWMNHTLGEFPELLSFAPTSLTR